MCVSRRHPRSSVRCWVSSLTHALLSSACTRRWPSVYVEELLDGPFHQRALAVSRALLGPDMAFDFDMVSSTEVQRPGAVPLVPMSCVRTTSVPEASSVTSFVQWPLHRPPC